MHQIDSLQQYCQFHPDMNILSVCINRDCQERRFVCFDCCVHNNLHQTHKDDLEKIWRLQQWVDGEAVYNSSIIDNIDKMNKILSEKLSFLKQDINNKTFFQPNIISTLNQKELNLSIEKGIRLKHYIQPFIKKMTQIHTEYIRSLEELTNDFRRQFFYIELSESQKQQCQELHNQAYELLEKEEYDKATQTIEDILKITGDSSDSFFYMGEILRIQGRFEESKKWFDKALKLNPKMINALASKGESLRLQKQFDDSIECYNQALKLEPKHSVALFGKGEALRMQGKYAESIEVLKEINYQNSNFDQALGSIGANLTAMHKYKLAQNYFDKALFSNPNNQFAKKQKENISCLIST